MPGAGPHDAPGCGCYSDGYGVRDAAVSPEISGVHRGMPESARLLGRPPAEWLQVMDHQDVLVAAIQ